MTNEMITAILASSVISSFITATVAYFQFKKNNQLVFITTERKSWRNDIRNIADRIELSKTYEDIRSPLVDLKVRINAYGIHSSDVMKDSHIWSTIDKLEKQEDDFEHIKKLLILYLSMLLKMDWERSKEEVLGNIFQISSYFMVLLSVISFAYKYLFSLKLSVDIPFVFSVLIMTYPIIMPERKGMNIDTALDYFNKDNLFIKEFCQSMSKSLLLFMGLTAIICAYLGAFSKIEEFTLSFIFFILAFLARFLREYRQYCLEVLYFLNISSVKKPEKSDITS